MNIHNIGVYGEIYKLSLNGHQMCIITASLINDLFPLYELCLEKISFRDFLPGETETGLYIDKRWLEA